MSRLTREQRLSAATEMNTVVDFVRLGASWLEQSDVFFGHGAEEAIDESMALVLHALSLRPGLPTEMWAAALTTAEKRKVTNLFNRRIEERIPVPYLTGRAWFAGLEFAVDQRVLIPRSPIAELIESGFEPWLDGRDPKRILDLGTGSGCIAIACALAFPNARIDASDKSAPALEVAARNVDQFALADRVELIESDLFDAIDGRYDLIVSNPPYVPGSHLPALPNEYAHEPPMALAAGDDGLDCVHALIENALAYLQPEGLLAVEVGVAREAFEGAYPDLQVVWPEFERGGGDVFVLRAVDLPG